jgi:hypothetical protein
MTYTIDKNKRILMGNAGLSNTHIKNGYIATLCTSDDTGNIVDMHLTKAHLEQIIKLCIDALEYA